ncbi:MAG: oligoendopeptidase F [Spirochaetes bacterium]|nr:MAG: oligoendopeptidase F [Spirochaetota bacterium]
MKIPERDRVNQKDKWDLSKLFKTEQEWETALKKLDSEMGKIGQFRGTLGSSVERLKDFLDLMTELEIQSERLGNYAFLKTSEDAGNSTNQNKMARYMRSASNLASEVSFFNPELQSIDEKVINEYLSDALLKDYLIALKRILRFKPYILSDKEEKLLAMQSESNQTPSKVFSALTDVDLDFGEVETPDGKVPLSQSTFGMLLVHKDRGVRERAYRQFYSVFENHKNTLSSLYSGSVLLDTYKAKARGYSSVRAMRLFPDNVPETVYDNLIDTIHKNLPLLHDYYAFRKKTLNVKSLKHWDVYVPLVQSVETRYTYEKAVETILKALSPLGEDYCSTLKNGLLGGWVDKYENKGKRSGAFSSGGYIGDPYILMNYKETVLRDLFTLAHEGGHSMHSWYSVRNNPFQHYSYTIFEAEVASTFNEQLTAKYLLENAENRSMKAYITGKQLDDIIATIFRQTMFAEFEHKAHKAVEEGIPLTVDSIRDMYRDLLESYFGDEMDLEEVSDLEALRIPHFYRAYYVYKYATGLSASIALSRKVLQGGERERNDYLGFLKSGGSQYPLESLKAAGVDMESPAPIEDAMEVFKDLFKDLKEYMK